MPIFNALSKIHLLCCLLVASLTLSAQQGPLNISGSWVREMPPGAPTLAAYMTISNPGESQIKIKGVSSSVSKLAELHEVSMENDMMQMRKVSGLVIMPGQTVEFKPGAMHVMLLQVTRSLREGDEVEIEFELENQPSFSITVPVKKDS